MFPYNNLIVLSNGTDTRVGSVTAAWEHYGEWKRVADEAEPGDTRLDTAIRGTCDPARLLDLVENFTLFAAVEGGTAKLLGRNYQVLGVNRAVAAMRDRERNAGRLGVFWHTQGSGKSYSMVFFAQKVLRKLPGDFTFVVVTDRDELDDQIHGTFKATGAVRPNERVQADSGEGLRQLLTGNHRYVFTLIQKFRPPDDGGAMPVLSDRRDLVVMTDEANRSQYAVFALNMRRALPHAAFLGFTGTPLMGDEQRTRQVFGDYVSVYNFRQSVEDAATVPLFYENRVPEEQLTNENLNQDLARVIDDAGLDEDQEQRLERELGRLYHLITREDRLDKIAGDLVAHFLGRGYPGKAMVVSIDKATAIKMYDKVRAGWDAELARARTEWDALVAGPERDALGRRVAFLAETDMAVIVSASQNEEATLAEKGVDIRPHRRRMNEERLDERFKNSDDRLRLVFVCAMWITGFDVPSLSTVYLDKPMRNHTLMQTIARANRVFGEKRNGLIVDYVGIFRDLEQALAIYGTGSGGGVDPGDSPVLPKTALVDELRAMLGTTRAFLAGLGIDVAALLAAAGFERVGLLGDARDALLVNDETKQRFMGLANGVALGYGAILPDPAAEAVRAEATLIAVLAKQIRALTPAADISGVMAAVERLLDASIATEGYVIREDADPGSRLVDLSQVDFAALRASFAKGRQRTQAERLKGAIAEKIRRLVELNRTRADYQDKFLRLIEKYNSGAINVQLYFEALLALAAELNDEEQRGIAANLSEEELAVFDLLTRPGPHLTTKETDQVKAAARGLLASLKRGRLVLDWRKRQQARAQVQRTIRRELQDGLPRAYSLIELAEKSDVVYQHVYEAYPGAGHSLYGSDAVGSGVRYA